MNVDDVRKSLQTFSWADYFVFVLMLASCAMIGIYFALQMRRESKDKQLTERDAEDTYLVGGRKMNIFPITMSLISSYISGITLLGTPTEVYLYGIQYLYIMGSLILMGFVMYYFFLPVFHDLKLISTYQYLETRFDRKMRLFGSVLFMLGTLLYLPIVIYIPALAFNQATGVNVHLITPIVSLVCIFYTCVGGLKAVVWTDVVQTMIMYLAMVLIIIKGTMDVGGPSVVIQHAVDSDRIESPNFDFDLTERYTVYSVIIGGVAHWLKSNAISQNMIQRYLSLPNMKMAHTAIWTFICGVLIFMLLCGYAGLLIYATYYDCDPIETKLVLTNDQLLPLLVMQTLGKFPGLPGIFVAGVFSAALSSLSTSLNAMAAVILEDFVKPFMKKSLTEFQTSLILRVVVVVFGLISLGLAFGVEKLGTVLQLGITLSSVANGPLLGIFTAGVMLPWIEAKGALVGGVSSLVFVAWLSIRAQADIATGVTVYDRKPYTTEGCNYTFADFTSMSLVSSNVSDASFREESESFKIYHISYLYYTMLGSIVTLVIAGITSFIIGFNKVEDVDKALLSPFVRWLIEKRNSKSATQSVISSIDSKPGQYTQTDKQKEADGHVTETTT